MAETIIVIDDDETARELTRRSLQSEGYEVYTAYDGLQGLDKIRVHKFAIAVVDLMMPRLSGEELVAQIKLFSPDTDVIIVTGHPSIETAVKTLKTGAYDYLAKPVELNNLRLVIKRCLEKRHLSEELDQERILRKELELAYRKLQTYTSENLALHIQLEQAVFDTIHRLSAAAEFRDDTTGTHIERMSAYAGLFAGKLGLPSDEVEEIKNAAPMHDIGKIGIRDNILLKPGKLLPEEFELIKQHTVIGAQILEKSSHPLIRLSQTIALTHHERYDGKGYPRGLRGREIPLSGRIVAVADVFDALTSSRCYKPAYTVDEAVQIIRQERNQQFDPEVTDVFLSSLPELVRLKDKYCS